MGPETHPQKRFLPLFGLLAIVIVMFEEVVFRGQAFYERDIYLVWYPYIEAVRYSVASGSFPFWNPFASFGQPLWANPAAQILYPFTWLALLLTPSLAYILFVLFHLVFSGFGLFLLGKRLGLSPQAAFVSGSIWMLSGPFLSMINLWHHFAGVSFFPWVLLATDHALRYPSLRHTVLLGVTIAAQILAGSADACAMALLLAAAYALRFVTGSSLLSLFRILGVAVFLAAALTAAQWVPSLEIMSRSARLSLDSPERQHWSLHPFTLVQVLLPFRWTEVPIADSFRELCFESAQPLLASLYLGTPAIALAVVSFARPRRLQIFFSLAAIIAVLVAFGRFGVLYPLAIRVLPPLKILRYPVKAMAVTAFAVAVLAGMGFDCLSDRSLRASRRLLVVGLASLVFIGALINHVSVAQPERFAPYLLPGDAPTHLAQLMPSVDRIGFASFLGGIAFLIALIFPTSSRSTLTALGLLTLLDLGVAHKTLNLTVVQSFFRYRPAIVAALPDRHAQRIHVRPYGLVREGPLYRRIFFPEIEKHTARDQATFTVERSLAFEDSLSPPLAGRWDIESSFDWDMLGLYPRPLQAAVEASLKAEGSPGYRRWLQVGAVDSVVAYESLLLSDLIPAGTFPSLYREPIHLFRVPEALPRCYAVSSAQIAETDAALHLVVDSRFDPKREVILPSGEPLAPAPDFHGTCTIRTLIPDRMEVDVSMSHPGFLITVDTYDPGWRVRVDGASAPLLRGNVAFRCVGLAAGQHRVEFRYRPTGLLVGSGLSLLAMGLTLGLLRA